jgi:two-component system LytT family response regulator
MNKINAIIVEDSRLARLELTTMLEGFDDIEIVAEADSADEARTLIEQHDPDLIFLDIHMPGKDGFALLEELESVPEVIFTTAYDEYAIKSFEYNALDYILKPVNPERLAQAIERFRKKENQREKYAQDTAPNNALDPDKKVFVKDGERCWLVRLGDIRLFEVYGNYSRVYFDQHKPLILRSLNQLEERLAPEVFFRANRQQIINVNHVEKVDTWFNGRLKVTMMGGAEVEISRRQAVKFKEMLSL